MTSLDTAAEETTKALLLFPLDGFRFTFLLRDSENDLMYNLQLDEVTDPNFQKFTLRFRPIRKEIASSMYKKFFCCSNIALSVRFRGINNFVIIPTNVLKQRCIAAFVVWVHEHFCPQVYGVILYPVPCRPVIISSLFPVSPRQIHF